MAVALRMERGESRADAELKARLEFGNITHVAEVTRDMWGGRRLETLRRDLAYAWRGLRRSPTFTIVATLTFALGIGATTTMFTIVNGVLLRPLPFDRPEQLVLLSHSPKSIANGASDVMSDGTFLELRAANSRAFASFASFGGNRVTLTGDGEPVEIIGAMASANFTRVLGVSPAKGRGFADDEETPGSPRVVILGDRMWHGHFGADSGVVGRSMVLNGVPHTVVGIMPPNFDFPNGAALWTPLSNALDPNLGELPSGGGEAPRRRDARDRPARARGHTSPFFRARRQRSRARRKRTCGRCSISSSPDPEPRCGCSAARSCSCCSSRAPTSRTSFSFASRLDSTRSGCDSRSARVARASCGNC